MGIRSIEIGLRSMEANSDADSIAIESALQGLAVCLRRAHRQYHGKRAILRAVSGTKRATRVWSISFGVELAARNGIDWSLLPHWHGLRSAGWPGSKRQSR